MNSDNYKLKKTLRESSSLPPGYEWEKMQGGIMQQMEKQMKPSAAKTKKRNWLNASYIVGCMLMTAVVAFYLGNRSAVKNISQASVNSIQSNQTTENQTSASKPENRNFIYNQSTAIKSSAKSNTKANVDNAQHLVISHGSQQVNKLQGQNGSTPQNLSTYDNAEPHQVPSSNSRHGGFSDATLNSTTKNSQLITGQNTVAQVSENERPQEIENNNLIIGFENKNSLPFAEATVTIQALAMKRIRLIMPGKEQINELGLVVNTPIKAIKPHLYSIAIGSGLTFITPEFTTTVGTEKTTSLERSVLSHTFALHIGRQLGKRWQLNTGVEYAKLWHRFDFVKETIREINVNNVAVEVHINAISGDSTFIYGDTIALKKDIRTIRHYNSIEVLTLPLFLGYEKKINDWSLKLNSGANLHWINKSQGKTLLANELIEYGDSTTIHKRFPGLSIRVGVGLGYAISNRLSVESEISASKSMGNWSSVSGTTFKPWIISSNLGIRYKF